MFIPKFNFICPGCPRPSFTEQKYKHHSFIVATIPATATSCSSHFHSASTWCLFWSADPRSLYAFSPGSNPRHVERADSDESGFSWKIKVCSVIQMDKGGHRRSDQQLVMDDLNIKTERWQMAIMGSWTEDRGCVMDYRQGLGNGQRTRTGKRTKDKDWEMDKA